MSRPFDGSFESAIEEGERLIFSSVSSRLLSDVPVGGFLSGGIDSSLIAALMQKASSRKIRTLQWVLRKKVMMSLSKPAL